jgi:DnaJ-class molecular chaperone
MAKRPFTMNYATYDVRHEGYGGPGSWRESFRARMTGEEAEAILHEDKPWTILDVPKSATWEQIRKAYRAACLVWHPDLPANKARQDAAVKMMQKINAAYALLEIQHGRA